jgi:Tfp pilus assembly protein PilO
MNALSIANTRLPARTVTVMGVFFAAVILAGAAFLYPVLREAARLTSQIEKEKARLEEQKVLAGVYQELKKLVDKGQAEDIPPAKSVPLPKVRVSGVAEIFEACAAKTGIETASVTPDPDSLARGGKSLSVRVTLRGAPEKFRDFLAEVGRTPSLETLETIRIQRVSEGFDYQVVAWLALE